MKSERYLIGPKSYDSYLLVLKIVFIAVFIGITISTVIGGILSQDPQANFTIIGRYLGTLFMAIMQGFAWVTIIFAIAERNDKTINIPLDGIWDSKTQEKNLTKNANISIVEAIFSIFFSTVFFYILYFRPEIFAIYYRGAEGMVTIPVINVEVLEGVRPILVAILLLNITKEIVKIILGKWSLKLSVAVSAVSLVSMALSLFILTRPNLLNPNFAEEVTKYVNFGVDTVKVITIIIVVGTIFEVVQNIYKGLKYDGYRF